MTELNAYPGIKNAVFLMLLFFGVTFAAALAFMISSDTFYKNNESVVMMVTVSMALGLIFFIGMKKSGMKLSGIIQFRITSYASLPVLLLSTVGFSIIFSELDNIFRSLVPMPDSMIKHTIDLITAENVFVSFIILSVAAPVFEEFVFRGLFLKGFLNNYSVIKSMIVSSLLFMVAHLNPWESVSYFCIGMILSWIFVKTGNILYCIILHSAYNFLPLFVMRFTDLRIRGYSDLNALDQFQPVAFNLLGATIAAGCLFFLHRLFKKNTEKTLEG